MAIPIQCRRRIVELSNQGRTPLMICALLGLDIKPRLITDAKTTDWWRAIEDQTAPRPLETIEDNRKAQPLQVTTKDDMLQSQSNGNANPVVIVSPQQGSSSPHVVVSKKPQAKAKGKRYPTHRPNKPTALNYELQSLQDLWTTNRIAEYSLPGQILILTGRRYEPCKVLQVEKGYITTDRGNVHRSKILVAIAPPSKDRLVNMLTWNKEVVDLKLPPCKEALRHKISKGNCYLIVLRNGMQLKLKVMHVNERYILAKTMYGDNLLCYHSSIYKFQLIDVVGFI